MVEIRGAKVFVIPYEVDLRLSELGLEHDVLESAVRQGELQRKLATPFDPPATGGFNAWARTVRSLRESLYGRGWIPNDRLNLSTVVNPAKTIAVAVSSADENTGKVGDADPRTRHSRGSATFAAVDRNARQGELFPELMVYEHSDLPSDIATWWLLFSSEADELRAELSLPTGMTEEGHFERFTERIILGVIEPGNEPFAEPLPETLPETPAVGGPPIEVRVERRA